MPNLDGISMMQKLCTLQAQGELLEYKDSLFIIATCQAEDSINGDIH